MEKLKQEGQEKVIGISLKETPSNAWGFNMYIETSLGYLILQNHYLSNLNKFNIHNNFGFHNCQLTSEDYN